MSNNIVVLISGDGSNLQAIIDACQTGVITGTISAVIANNNSAYGLQRAKQAGIPTHTVLATEFTDKGQFDQKLIQIITPYQPKFIILAGYMRILTAEFVQHFAGKIINIHPSLLPKYPGLHTHQQVLANQDRQHGSSIHFVTEQLDSGPIIYQTTFSVTPEDTLDSLTQRIKQLEHHCYPRIIQLLLNNRIKMVAGQAWFDEQPITFNSYSLNES